MKAAGKPEDLKLDYCTNHRDGPMNLDVIASPILVFDPGDDTIDGGKGPDQDDLCTMGAEKMKCAMLLHRMAEGPFDPGGESFRPARCAAFREERAAARDLRCLRL